MVCCIDVTRVGRVLRNTEIIVECQGYLSSPTNVIIVEVEESCMRLDDCINTLSAS
jgi:N-dimethylarginine dimethylaminohydrolase